MEQFLTNNEQIKSIIKNINITRTLFLSSIIVGEEYIGKLHLASYLFPSATIINAAVENINEALKGVDEAIITHFEKVKNIDNLDFDNKRIIALATFFRQQKDYSRQICLCLSNALTQRTPRRYRAISPLFFK